MERERVDKKEKERKGEKKRQSEGGGKKRQKEKPLHPSAPTSRPPSVPGLSLFPLSAFLFSFFPFCLLFQHDDPQRFYLLLQKDTSQYVCARPSKSKEVLMWHSNLSAKLTCDAFEALLWRNGNMLFSAKLPLHKSFKTQLHVGSNKNSDSTKVQ